MSTTYNLLISFIQEERNRFETRHNNLFAGSLSEVNRYYYFLTIILNRYKYSVTEYKRIFEAFQNSIDKSPGSHLMTDEQMGLDQEMIRITHVIHLDVESFYQFAKILLDKTACAIEFYFGRREKQRHRITSHHDMVEKKNNTSVCKIQDYCSIKNLSMSQILIDKMIAMQRDINDFRDDFITHLNSPRTIRGTSIAGHMSLNRIYPRENERGESPSTKELHQLLEEIAEYLESVVNFIKANKEKTTLTLITATGR